MDSEVRDAMNDCLVVQSGGCHSSDGMCPNYLAKKRSATCKNFLKFMYPDKFPGVVYTDVKWNAWSDNKGYYRSLFDDAKHTICKNPEYMDREFCSCLARTNEASRWNKGGGDEPGFRKILKQFTDNGIPIEQPQCWYGDCYEPADPDYLQTTPKIMTTTDLKNTDGCKGPKCVFTVSNFAKGGKIDIGKYKSSCNISDGGGGTAPPAPDAPSQSRNVILILAAVLVPLVLLILLFRRLLR